VNTLRNYAKFSFVCVIVAGTLVAGHMLSRLLTPAGDHWTGDPSMTQPSPVYEALVKNAEKDQGESTAPQGAEHEVGLPAADEAR
jgi:hypothetical protein